MKPGDKLAFTGTDTTAVMSDSVPLKTPIAEGARRRAAESAVRRAQAARRKQSRSRQPPLGRLRDEFGRFRTIDLGDLTWSREFMLMCPNNPDWARSICT